MFSGRPNPSWELDASEAAQLQAAVNRLVPAPTLALPQGLGFRGLVCTDEPSQRRIVAHQGTVWVIDPSGVACHRDAAREVERTLLAQARARMAPELLDLLAGELALE